VSIATQDAARHMDGIYKYQRYIYNATRKFYLLGRDRLIDALQPEDGSTVVEVGCGTGRNLIQAARRYPNARFVGFDISRAMLETARTSIARAGLSNRIDVYQADATAFDLSDVCGEAKAGRVFISYTLSMIPPWRQVLPGASGCRSGQPAVHFRLRSARGLAPLVQGSVVRVAASVLRASAGGTRAGTHQTGQRDRRCAGLSAFVSRLRRLRRDHKAGVKAPSGPPRSEMTLGGGAWQARRDRQSIACATNGFSTVNHLLTIFSQHPD